MLLPSNVVRCAKDIARMYKGQSVGIALESRNDPAMSFRPSKWREPEPAPYRMLTITTSNARISFVCETDAPDGSMEVLADDIPSRFEEQGKQHRNGGSVCYGARSTLFERVVPLAADEIQFPAKPERNGGAYLGGGAAWIGNGMAAYRHGVSMIVVDAPWARVEGWYQPDLYRFGHRCKVSDLTPLEGQRARILDEILSADYPQGGAVLKTSDIKKTARMYASGGNVDIGGVLVEAKCASAMTGTVVMTHNYTNARFQGDGWTLYTLIQTAEAEQTAQAA